MITTAVRPQISECVNWWFNPSIAHQHLCRSDNVFGISSRVCAAYVPLAREKVFAGFDCAGAAGPADWCQTPELVSARSQCQHPSPVLTGLYPAASTSAIASSR